MYLLSLICGLCSILSISLFTPIQSILCLLILFISVALLLCFNNFILLGLLYLLIYVGAIVVLFIFIISLLNITYIPLSIKNRNEEYTVSSILITLILILILPFEIINIEENNIIIENIMKIDNELITVGTQLYTEYAILLIFISLILILSIIGAICLII